METTSTRKSDSPQEFVRSGILCGFPGYLNSNIFGVDHGHAPRFQYEIARVLIYAAAVDQHTDVIVDSFFACPVLTCPPIVPLPAAGKKQESHLCGLWSGGAPTLVRLLPLRNRFPWPDGIAASPIPVSFFACVFSRFDSRRSIRHRLQKARKENVVKKFLTRLVVAAPMALTIGASFASPKADCCNGGACCGGACCYSHHNK
jgi:hypothetical protein